MTDDPKHLRVQGHKVRRHHEVDVEPHAHPGEPRRVVSTDHEDCLREPSPISRRSSRHEREVRS
jgi:hypothetical protein